MPALAGLADRYPGPRELDDQVIYLSREPWRPLWLWERGQAVLQEDSLASARRMPDPQARRRSV